jgi:hypothetical protein
MASVKFIVGPVSLGAAVGELGGAPVPASLGAAVGELGAALVYGLITTT